MQTISNWFQNNMDLVFILYGLAFFIMGVSILSQPKKGSKLKLANILWVLAYFGLTHSINEWLDAWEIIKGYNRSLAGIRFYILLISYFFLFEFGRRLFLLEKEKYPVILKKFSKCLSWWVAPVLVLCIYFLGAFFNESLHSEEIWTRYLLGFPSGILIGAGFILYYYYERQIFKPIGVRRYFIGASLTFLFYGVLGGLIVHKSDFFPSNLLNKDLFLSLTKIPVQVFRLICAAVATWSIVGISRIFNWETIKILEEEINKRKKFEAEREKLNEQLLKTNENLRRLALRDSHTGLYNHGYLVRIIESELSRAKRYEHPLSVIFMDIDFFKSINDVYGHQFGDLVLKQFANNLQKVVRSSDILVRYGGEEFVVILPQISIVDAMALSGRILASINSYEFGNGTQTVKLKVSIAVSSYPNDYVHRGMDLVELADKILIKAKEHGGNRVYSSEDTKNNKGVPVETIQESSDVSTLKDKIYRLTKRANQSVIEATAAFAKTIEIKDYHTGDHVEKTVLYATEIAKALGISGESIENIQQASMLHDLGKVGISEEILSKPTNLTEEEFMKIKAHPQIGADIIRPIQFMQSVIPLIRHHHERWDGRGYPAELKGKEIPIGARIIAVADAYQALTSDRPYRKAYSKEEAIRIIQEEAGSHFDPEIVKIFTEIFNRDTQIK
ncbi:MAG: diguanylate cyclase [Candidatus Omnitrophica bacterium]|nr:diguanylate cyclase [Candidatus Omnitrophota bacterium]